MADVYQMVFNSLDRPVVIDADGRTLGGGEWGVARRAADETGDAITAGRLIVIDDSSTSLAPQAAAAAAQLASLNGLADGLNGLDRDALFGLAAQNGLMNDSDPEPYKDELVDILARSGVAAPSEPAADQPTEHEQAAAAAAHPSTSRRRGGK